MVKFLLAVGLTLFCASAGFSETRTISLSNAIDLSMQNNLQLKQYEQDYKIAEAQYFQSIGDFAVPSVSASGTLTLLDTTTVSNANASAPNLVFSMTNSIVTSGPGAGGIVPIPAFTQNGFITNAYLDNYGASLTVSKPLFVGFKLWNAMMIKRINYDLAKAKFEDKQRETIANATTSFYNLFILKENIKLTSDLNRSLKERLDYTKANYQAGMAAEFDLIRADVAFKNNQPRLLQIKNGYLTFKMSYCDSLGLKDYTNIEFTGNLLDSTNMQIAISEDEAIALALTNDINIRTMDVSLQSLKIAREITAASRYPTLSGFFTYKYDFKKKASTDTDRAWVDSWSTGLQLSVPLDTLIPFTKTWYALDEGDANIKKMEMTRQQLLDGTILQVRTLLMQIELSKQIIQSQAESMRQSKVGLDIATTRYKAGTSSSLDVTDAEVSYNQSQVNYLQTIYDYFSSVIKLKRIIGR